MLWSQGSLRLPELQPRLKRGPVGRVDVGRVRSVIPLQPFPLWARTRCLFRNLCPHVAFLAVYTESVCSPLTVAADHLVPAPRPLITVFSHSLPGSPPCWSYRFRCNFLPWKVDPTGLTQKSIICPERFSNHFPKLGFLYSSCLSFARQLSLPQICPTRLQSLEVTQALPELYVAHREHLCKLETCLLTSMMHPCSGHIAFWEEQGLDVSLLFPIICTVILYNFVVGKGIK